MHSNIVTSMDKFIYINFNLIPFRYEESKMQGDRENMILNGTAAYANFVLVQPKICTSLTMIFTILADNHP